MINPDDYFVYDGIEHATYGTLAERLYSDIIAYNEEQKQINELMLDVISYLDINVPTKSREMDAKINTLYSKLKEQ